MSVGKQLPVDDKKSQNSAEPEDDKATSPIGSKESPSARLEEEKLVKQVVERSRQADLEAQSAVEEAIGKEARLSRPEVEIGPDLADHGVKSPQKEASGVIENGTTLTIPISEEEYARGEHAKFNSKVSDNSVFGILSLSGLVILFGKWIKNAHKHAKKVIFRREDVG